MEEGWARKNAKIMRFKGQIDVYGMKFMSGIVIDENSILAMIPKWHESKQTLNSQSPNVKP